MQLEQHFIVAVPLARVWEAFHDPELLVSCLPGASLRGPAEGSTLPLTFKVKLGPIAAAFAGTGELTLDDAGHRGALSGQAADGKSNSRVKGDAAFDLTAVEGGTRVGVNVTFSITGSLAQFSREGIVRALADQLTRQFAENLQGVLARDAFGEDALPDASSSPLPAHAHAHADAASAPASSGPVHAPAVAPPSAAATATAAAKARSAAEAPALNLFTLIGAVIRDYWRKFFNRKPS
ncbi:SRPBCC family protein [Alcaligenaceae bacterium C4P045]|nr:SRPBCC family protein [Alcaligenaceae bacterium C4P045]